MKLISCHVENFGKLHNYDFNFQEGLNEILQDNGWGKTTFAVFLKAMLYGMPKKGNNKPYAVDRSKYTPWQGGVYGGTLTFEHENNIYKMYRTFGSTPERDMFSVIDQSTNKRTNKFTENFGYEVYGVGRETFEITTYFPQVAVQGKLTDEMRASLSGVNNYQNDLKNYSKAIEKIENKIKQYKKEITSYSMYEGNLFKIAKIENEIQKDENDILKLQDQIEVLQENLITLKEEYEKAQKDLEVKELYKKEINDLKEQIINKKSELLAFRIKLEELKKENQKRGLKNKFIFSNKRTIDILYYGSIILCMALLTLFAFEFIYGASTLFLIITACIMAVDSALIYYCLWLKKKGHVVLNQRIEVENYQRQVDSLDSEIKLMTDIVLAKEKNQPEIEIEGEQEKNNIIANYSNCQKNIEMSKMQISFIQKNIESLEAEKETLMLEQTSMQEKKMTAEEKIKMLNLTRDFLSIAKLNLSKRYIAPMQQKFTNYVNQIVQEGANKYMLDVDTNITFENVDGNKEIEYLSQGYQDLMNICRRFSLIDSIFEKEKPIIILDDPFVNLDDIINKNAVKLLKKMAENYQIVYLYCHSSRRL
jgi:DNA repair exonuclease SbcCD ATPase subunit